MSECETIRQHNYTSTSKIKLKNVKQMRSNLNLQTVYDI